MQKLKKKKKKESPFWIQENTSWFTADRLKAPHHSTEWASPAASLGVTMPSRLHSGFSPHAAWGSGRKAAVQGTMGGMFPLSSSEKHKKMTDWRVPLGDEKADGGALGSDVAPCSQGRRAVWGALSMG